MKYNTPSFFLPLYMGIRAFFGGFTRIALFEICYKAASALLLKPLLSFILHLLLTIGGNGPALNEQIWGFAFSVPGVLAAVILAGVSSVMVYFEFAVIISIVLQIQDRESLSLSAAISQAIWSFKSLRSPGVFFFALYSLVLLPLIHMGVTSSLLPNISIPNFITGELTKSFEGEVLLLLGAMVISVIFIALLFVLPSMVVEHTHFGRAVRRSIRTIKRYGLKMIGILAAFVTLWVIMFILPRMLSEQVFGLPNVTFGEALNLWGFSPRTPVILLVWLLISMAAQVLLMPLLLTILTAYFIQVTKPKPTDDEAIAKIDSGLDNLTSMLQQGLKVTGRITWRMLCRLRASELVRRNKKAVAAIIAVIMIIIIYQVCFLVYHAPNPVVIGHRGSAYGVENTLEAIEAAIEAGADYVEIDVMLSADHVPVVIHDSNLTRLSGVNSNVYDLTAQELSDLTLSQNGYTGQIPTLEEVIAYCEGRILLAIELKPHGKEEKSLAQAVMDELTKSVYQRDCLIFSQNHTAITSIIAAYPSYHVGYCVYGNIGQIRTSQLREMGINFLCVEEGMATKALVSTCQKADVLLFAWTVNDAAAMEAYLDIGVLGLITDYPETAVEILNRNIFLSGK